MTGVLVSKPRAYKVIGDGHRRLARTAENLCSGKDDVSSSHDR